MANDSKLITNQEKFLDEYYITSGCVKDRREIFEKLWQKYKPYADRHFLSELKNSFIKEHGKCFWEYF